MTPADLRALAKRACEEKPSRELDDAIAFTRLPSDAEHPTKSIYGWKYRVFGLTGWEDEWLDTKPYTISLDAAASLMPGGWWLHRVGEVRREIVCAGDRHQPLGIFRCEIQHVRGGRLQCAEAPTEPQARAAAALLARAADMEGTA